MPRPSCPDGALVRWGFARDCPQTGQGIVDGLVISQMWVLRSYSTQVAFFLALVITIVDEMGAQFSGRRGPRCT